MVGTMEKMWAGGNADGQGTAANGGAASAAQQQARLDSALNSGEFGEDEYVQVCSRGSCPLAFVVLLMCSALEAGLHKTLSTCPESNRWMACRRDSSRQR